MKNTFVIRTDDKNLKESIGKYLSNHCNEHNVNAVVYEVNQEGAKEIMGIIKRK